jgi:hypothetical protein
MKDGDKLASGAKTAKFQATEKMSLTDEIYNQRVELPKAEPKLFCGCNAKGCENFQAFSAEEFSDHFHLVHANELVELPA